MSGRHTGSKGAVVSEDGAVKLSLDFLDPEKITFDRTGTGTLRMHIADEVTYLDVRIRQAFPVSDTEHYIEICGKDKKHLGMIYSFASLSEENRRLVEEEIERSYMIPVVSAITKLTLRHGSMHLEVETNRGHATLYIFHPHDDITYLRDGRLRVKDALENVYEIRPWALDASSTQHLEKML
ncbi:MAG: DUF1854 domain-containing protein [Planctomycetes bacterium]|nr:DUF1854 domain-containing protein [Planctomycetota bacterium]